MIDCRQSPTITQCRSNSRPKKLNAKTYVPLQQDPTSINQTGPNNREKAHTEHRLERMLPATTRSIRLIPHL